MQNVFLWIVFYTSLSKFLYFSLSHFGYHSVSSWSTCCKVDFVGRTEAKVMQSADLLHYRSFCDAKHIVTHLQKSASQFQWTAW